MIMTMPVAVLFLQDEDPENSWHMLQENDMVALLNQMPLSIAFRHVLGVDADAREGRHLTPHYTEQMFARVHTYSTL